MQKDRTTVTDRDLLISSRSLVMAHYEWYFSNENRRNGGVSN